MDDQYIKEEKQKETLDKIINELRGYVTFTVFKECTRLPYEKRWPEFYKRIDYFKKNELPEQEQEWKDNLVTILTNLDVFDKYAESGKIDFQEFAKFIKDVEENHSHLLKSSTLRKLIITYKQKLDFYTSNNHEPKKRKIKKKK